MTTTPDATRSSAPSQPRTRLAVFGATRGVGRHAVAFALDAGHRVRVLARDPARLQLHDPHLEIVQGDATDPDAVRKTLRGADAVLCTLGAPAWSRTRVRTEGTRTILAAMQAEGLRRLLCVSVFGAADSRSALPFWLRYLLFPLYLRRAVADHEAQERMVAASELDWTIVRPPFLTDGPRTGLFAHGFAGREPGLTLKISRADVAGFMLEQVGRRDYVRRSVGVSYRA